MFGSKSSAGVDIGSNTVKVVQLRRTGDKIELEKAGTAAIYPDGERPGDPVAQRQAKVDAVKRALSAARITTKNSVSAVSGESIIVRYLQLPEMPEEELKKALQWEAEEYIPFRLDEVNIDSMVLGKADGGDDRVDVLLVSAKKDLVEEHLHIIRESGMTPKIVDVDSFAFLNCFSANYDTAENECVALINIGAEITSISIYLSGVSRFSRDIPVGGDAITTAIRSHLRCSYSEAETIKITHGASPQEPEAEASDKDDSFSTSIMETIRGTVSEMTDGGGEMSREEATSRAVGAVLSDLVSEVRRSIEFFENQMRGMSVSKIILGGGTSAMANLKENFESELGLTVEIIDPFRKITPAGKDLNMAALEPIRHSLAVGIGLGLRGLAA